MGVKKRDSHFTGNLIIVVIIHCSMADEFLSENDSASECKISLFRDSFQSRNAFDANVVPQQYLNETAVINVM